MEIATMRCPSSTGRYLALPPMVPIQTAIDPSQDLTVTAATIHYNSAPSIETRFPRLNCARVAFMIADRLKVFTSQVIIVEYLW